LILKENIIRIIKVLQAIDYSVAEYMIEKERLIAHNLIILEKSMISNKKKNGILFLSSRKILHVTLPEFKIRTLILTKKPCGKLLFQ
jgi:hypothetical protein